MALVPSHAILDDHAPKDELARRVVVLDLDEKAAANLASQLTADAVLEPLVYRKLHHRRPTEVRTAIPFRAPTARPSAQYQVTITGGGRPLADIDVLFYVADPSGQISTNTVRTNANDEP